MTGYKFTRTTSSFEKIKEYDVSSIILGQSEKTVMDKIIQKDSIRIHP